MKQVGLIGYPVAHSLSPQMHQAAFDALGIVARYSLWETTLGMLPERIAVLRSSDVLGANVTIPYKEDVVPLVDQCDPAAARIGAINTIVKRDGCLVGYNTDAPGFIRALGEDAQYACHGKRAVILGTGGAARAAAVALLENGVDELTLLGRTEGRIQALLNHLRMLVVAGETHDFRSGQERATTRVRPYGRGAILGSMEANVVLATADLVVNATSVGLKADDTGMLFDIQLLSTQALVMDMIFNPPLTPLLRAAQAHGCRIRNGLPMLLYQGALAFELWTGRTAPVEIMRTALGWTQGE